MSDQGDGDAQLVIDDCKDKMHKAIEHLKGEFARRAHRTGQPTLVDKLKVDAYGSEVPIQQLAGFSVPEPRVLVDQPLRQGDDQGHRAAPSRAATSASPPTTTAR